MDYDDDDDSEALDIPAMALLLDKLGKLGSQPHGDYFRKLGQQLVQGLGQEDFEKLMSYVSEQDYWRERAAGRE